VPKGVKVIKNFKFSVKVLVWLAISEKGISDPVFINIGLAANIEVYTAKCLPLFDKSFKKYQQKERVVFWPDLATTQRDA
jgi:hypothetical protein